VSKEDMPIACPLGRNGEDCGDLDERHSEMRYYLEYAKFSRWFWKEVAKNAARKLVVE